MTDPEHYAETALLRRQWQSLFTQFRRWQQHNPWFADVRNEVDPEFAVLERRCRGKQAAFATDLEAFIQHVGLEHAIAVFDLLVAVEQATPEARAAA